MPAGFIKLNALRFIIEGKAQGKKAKKPSKKLDKLGAKKFRQERSKKSGQKRSKKIMRKSLAFMLAFFYGCGTVYTPGVPQVWQVVRKRA